MRRLSVFLALLALAGPAWAAAGGGGGPAANPQAASVTVDDTSPGKTLPANYVGLTLSYGFDWGPCTNASGQTWSPTVPSAGYLVSTNTALVNTIDLIAASGIITLGGNGADSCVPVTYPSNTLITQLAGFMKATGWGYNHTLNVLAQDPTNAASQASLITTAFATAGAVTPTFYIGEEPNFVRSGWTFTAPAANFPTPWNNVITAASWAATSGGQATFTTTVAHGLTSGNKVVVGGFTPTGWNGTYTATTGTTGSTIVVPLTAGNPGAVTVNGQTPGPGELAYYAQWAAYFTAIRGSVSGANFWGPDETGTGNPSYVGNFCPYVGSTGITAITDHIYPLGSGANNPLANIPNLLTSYGSSTGGILTPAAWLSVVLSPAAAACGSGVPAIETDTNSVYTQGPYVANSQASGVWAIDYGMALWNGGTGGLSHWSLAGTLQSPAYRAANGGFGPIYYSPFWDDLTAGIGVNPLFYGLMMLGAVEGGQALPVTACPGSAGAINLGCYGFKGGDGKTRILVTNRDTQRAATVTLGRTSAFTSAAVSILTGPGCAATTATYAGATVSSTGTFAPTPLTVPSGSSFTLPPCSAAYALLT